MEVKPYQMGCFGVNRRYQSGPDMPSPGPRTLCAGLFCPFWPERLAMRFRLADASNVQIQLEMEPGFVRSPSREPHL